MDNLIKREFKLTTPTHGRSFLADITTIESTKKLPVIVFVHGFKGFKDWGHFNLLAEKFARMGYAFVKFNFAFNGTTLDDPHNFADLNAFGHNTFTKELADIDTVLNHLHSQPWSDLSLDLDRLNLIGHSRGGGIGLVKAAEEQRIKKVASWAAVHDFAMNFTDELIAQWQKEEVFYIQNARTGQNMPMYLGIYEDVQQNKARLSPMNAVAQMDKPILIIHGTNDETVPLAAAQALKSTNNKAELYVIEGADHVFGGTHPFEGNDLHPHTYDVLNKTVSFFSDN